VTTVDGPGVAHGQRAQDVVGFVALHACRRDPERVEDLEQHGDLWRERRWLVLGPALDVRCSLYDGTAATRNAGRQSRSRQATSRAGLVSRTTRAMRSSVPRTAFTGDPSGAVTDSGTPWNARYQSEGASRSVS
jgi:hypothetical protein